jgi:hypothetical protein
LRKNLGAERHVDKFWSLWALMFVVWPPVPLNLPPPNPRQKSAARGTAETKGRVSDGRAGRTALDALRHAAY